MASLLPKTLQDKSNLAIEKIIAETFDPDISPLMIYLVDSVDSKLLPLLAEQFHVQGDEGWNYCRNEQEQRALIKSSIPLHRYKGTKPAVLRALEILKIEGKLEQWFEYDGIPYHFRLSLKVFDRNLDEETEKTLLRLINIFKNKRSILDGIDVYLSAKVESTVFCRMLFGEVLTIRARK